MIRALREHLALVFVATFLGLFFVFNGDEQFMPFRLAMIVWLVVAVLAWKPLHKRFSAWAILLAYFQMSVPLLLVSEPSASLSDFLEVLLLAFVSSVVLLLFNRREPKPKPIEQRRPDLTSMIINGDWAQLARFGIPADEIGRLKRLTREERVALADALARARAKARADVLARMESISRSRELALHKLFDDDDLNPAYSFSLSNAYHSCDDWYYWLGDD